MKNGKNWKVIYEDYDPAQESLREALCTLGNGYFATRGASEESKADEIHYPGTYLASGFNRLKTKISGKTIENEDLVNWPNWTILKFKVEDGPWFSLDEVEIISYRQELDLYNAVLSRHIEFKDQDNRKTSLTSRRVVCMDRKNLAGIEWKLKPHNWSGKITIHSALDGSVINHGVERYRDLNSKHLDVLDKGGFEENSLFLKVQTNESKIVLAQATRTSVFPEVAKSNLIEEAEYIALEWELDAKEQNEISVEKLVSIVTSKDNAVFEPLLEAKKMVSRVENFEELYTKNKVVWKALWRESDMILDADNGEDQLVLRLHIFHIHQTASFNILGMDAGVPARGLHGEAYRGHIFWDELFVFPFFNLSRPEISRSLLLYRYRRLNEARYAAAKEGYRGAMYPWQSGSDGREETQIIHLNPASGNWLPDNTHLQRHVNATIAYNIWHYFEITGDFMFLSFYGAEMLLEIAKFWESKVTYNPQRDRYEIHEVVGPDEYHTSYPDSDKPGLKNNAYTNIMAVFCFIHALKAIEKIDKDVGEVLLEQLEVTEADLKKWDEITRKMYVPFLGKKKIIEQFEGFDDLKELDWEKYKKEHGEILRLDRILEKEGDDVKNYKAVKQADVLMLFFLFSAEELVEMFNRMGYEFDPSKQIPATISYYRNITAHGSTLSKVVHSWVYARSHRKESWRNFKKALISDFKDIQGGTTAEGIHLGAMAGTLDLIQRCYTGMEFREDSVFFNPCLPENVKEIKFRLRYRKHWVEVEITKNKFRLASVGGWGGTIRFMLVDEEITLQKGDTKEVDYQHKPSRK